MAKKYSQSQIDELIAINTSRLEELIAARANNARLERELADAKEESLALRSVRYTTLDGIRLETGGVFGNEDFGDVCGALVKNDLRYRQLIASKRAEAKRVVEAADKLKSSLRFIAKCTTGQTGATYVGAGKAMSITIDEILNQVCAEIDSLISSHRGVVDGRQEYAMEDAVLRLAESKKSKEPGQ